MLYKTLAFKLGADTNLAPGTFAGYGAAFSNVDGAGEIIQQGAFAATLPRFLADGAICWQHEWDTPIGKPLKAHEDSYGLYLEAAISDTVAGRDALTLLRDGVVKKMSIGYEVEGYKVLSDEEGRALLGDVGYAAALRDLPWWQDQIRVLTAIKLYEVSLVTVPANPKAVVTGVKEGSLAGLSHDDHFSTVHAAVREYLSRVKAVQDLRAKAGRMLSGANVSKLEAMRDSLAEHCKAIDDLLAANNAGDDPDGDADPGESSDKTLLADIAREYLRYERWKALGGVA